MKKSWGLFLCPEKGGESVLVQVVCAWCERLMGVKEAENDSLPISHSICCECKRKLEEETKSLLHQTKTIHS
jgi:hypothetical protein